MSIPVERPAVENPSKIYHKSTSQRLDAQMNNSLMNTRQAKPLFIALCLAKGFVQIPDKLWEKCHHEDSILHIGIEPYALISDVVTSESFKSYIAQHLVLNIVLRMFYFCSGLLERTG